MSAWRVKTAGGARIAAGAEGDEFRAWLRALQPLEPRAIGTLELTPLIGPAAAGEPLVLIHEALASGQVVIVEEGAGTVNAVTAHNRGPGAVLVLEGESIVGAKQNRVVTLDVLIAAGETIAIPVGCVERGRWDARHGAFRASDSPVEPSIRAATVREMNGAGHLDQVRLWRDVESKLAAARVSSATGDYHSFVHARLSEAEAILREIPALPGQVGVLALQAGRLVGLDCVGHAANWSALAHRLVRSYVLGAAEAPGGGSAAAPRGEPAAGLRARDWLGAIASARLRERPRVGIGVRLSIEGDTLAGAALWHESRPAHVSAFGLAPVGDPESPRKRPGLVP